MLFSAIFGLLSLAKTSAFIGAATLNSRNNGLQNQRTIVHPVQNTQRRVRMYASPQLIPIPVESDAPNYNSLEKSKSPTKYKSLPFVYVEPKINPLLDIMDPKVVNDIGRVDQQFSLIVQSLILSNKAEQSLIDARATLVDSKLNNNGWISAESLQYTFDLYSEIRKIKKELDAAKANMFKDAETLLKQVVKKIGVKSGFPGSYEINFPEYQYENEEIVNGGKILPPFGFVF